jgi:TRAP transporter TAXI family solute receptor
MNEKRSFSKPGIVAFLVFTLVCIPSPAAAQSKQVTLLTGQPGQYYEAVGKAIQTVARRRHLEITVLHSTGSKDNIDKLVMGCADFAIVQSDAAHRVWYREAPFDDLPSAFKLRLAAPLFIEKVQILARPHLYVSSPAELKGRCLWLGGKDSGSALSAISVLEASGFTPDEAGKIASGDQGCRTGANLRQPQNFNEAVAMLRAGNLDAVFQTSVAPTGRILEPLATSEIHLVGLDWNQVEKLGANGIYLANSLQRTDYPQLQHGIYTVGVQALLVTREGVDAEVVKALVHTLEDDQADLETELRSILEKNPGARGKVDPGVLNLLGSRPTDQLFNQAPDYVQELLPSWRLPRRSIFQLIPIGLFLAALPFLYLLVLKEKHRHKIRQAPMTYLVLAMLVSGALGVLLFGAVYLHTVEGNVNEHFSSLWGSAASLVRIVLAKLFFGDPPTPTTPEGRNLASAFAWILVSAWTVLTSLLVTFRKRIRGVSGHTPAPPTTIERESIEARRDL